MPLASRRVSWLALWSSACAFWLLFRSFCLFHFLKCLSLNSRKHSDIIYLSKYLSHFPVAAFEEDGGENSQVPDPERRDHHRLGQVPEVERWGEHARGARALLPAPDPPVAGQQLRTRLWPALGVPGPAAFVTAGHVFLVTSQ